MKKGDAVVSFKEESKLRMKDLQVLAEVALDMGFISTAVKYVHSAVNAATEEKVEKSAKKKVLASDHTQWTAHKEKTPYFLDEQL